jgi:hemerythrin-like metal-binding protein
MAIEWTAELAVGIPELDRQHQHLYAIASALHEVMRAGRRDPLPGILTLLREWAVAHFAAEERHMAWQRFPGLAAHRARHAEFLEQLARLEAEAAEALRPSLVVDVSIFLGQWMRDHVRGHDLEFSRWLAAAGEAEVSGA